MSRFMVVGTQRTGSSLISTSLDSHPKICSLGEAFKMRRRKVLPIRGEWGYLNYIQGSFRRRLGHYACRALVVRRYLDELYAQRDYDAVGFKFMYNQQKRFPMVVPYAKEHGIRAIHVVRENVLHTLLSQLTATVRGFYHSTEQVSATRVTIPTADLLRRLETIKRDSVRWRETLKGSVPYLQVCYESFLADKESETKRMLDFLEADYAPLRSKLVKLNPTDLSEVVRNYDEVKHCLVGTPFAECMS